MLPVMGGPLFRHLHGKNSVNAATGDVGMLLDPLALKSLESIKKTQPKIMLLNRIQPEFEKILGKFRTAFKDSDNLSNHRRSTNKES